MDQTELVSRGVHRCRSSIARRRSGGERDGQRRGHRLPRHHRAKAARRGAEAAGRGARPAPGDGRRNRWPCSTPCSRAPPSGWPTSTAGSATGGSTRPSPRSSGRPVEDHLGRTVREIVPSLPTCWSPAPPCAGDRRAAPGPGARLGRPAPTPGRRYSLASYFPVRAGDRSSGWEWRRWISPSGSGPSKALQESEEQYRAVYSQAATGIAEADLTGGIVRANDRYCGIVGYSREELLGKRFVDITHPHDRAGSIGPFERLIDGGPMLCHRESATSARTARPSGPGWPSR